MSAAALAPLQLSAPCAWPGCDCSGSLWARYCARHSRAVDSVYDAAEALYAIGLKIEADLLRIVEDPTELAALVSHDLTLVGAALRAARATAGNRAAIVEARTRLEQLREQLRGLS
jgi:hypothetical protein